MLAFFTILSIPHTPRHISIKEKKICLNFYTGVGNYINTIKTTLELNFDVN